MADKLRIPLANALTITALAFLSGLLSLMVMPARPAAGQEVDVVTIIVEAAERWNLPPGRLMCMAFRESSFNPAAVNWQDGSLGLWQFQPRTWFWASRQAGYEGFSPFDPVASTGVAMWMLSQGMWRDWSTAAGCWWA